jgi:hypothetical protein
MSFIELIFRMPLKVQQILHKEGFTGILMDWIGHHGPSNPSRRARRARRRHGSIETGQSRGSQICHPPTN